MKIKRLFAILITAVCGITAAAQNGTVTPYSRFGYGILGDNASSAQRSMGGVGYAMKSGRQVNAMNPASYASLDSLTFLFDMGVTLKFINSEEGNLHENTTNGGLDYLTMAFPISKRIGASFGLLPYSFTGYKFSDRITNASTSHDGSGSISQLYVGVGVNPFSTLNIGVDFAYVFGSLTNDVYATNINNSTSLFQRFMRVRDYKLDFGAQYTLFPASDHSVTLGATFSPGKSFRGETYGIYYDATLDSKPDTIGYMKLKGRNTMPATWGAGINYQWRDRLTAEIDFTYQPWKDAKYAPIEDFETNEFDNRWKVAAGLEYCPAPRGSWLKRIQYRLGGYFNHDYIVVQGNNVREYGMTLGLGLPVSGFKTRINLGFEYKHRQAHPNPLIKENYFNITLGVTFNEMWFDKFKLH